MQKGRCKHVRDESKGGPDISNMYPGLGLTGVGALSGSWSLSKLG
jgi:hypothetical protein